MEVGQIDYEPRQLTHSQRRIGRLFTVTVLILALSVAAYKAAPILWRHAKLSYWQHRAMTFQPPDRQIVYDDDPAHYRKLLDSGEFDELTGSYSGSTAIRLEATWYEFAGATLPYDHVVMNATLFLHELRKSNGEARLVEIEGGIPRCVLDGPLPAGSRQSFGLWCRVMRPAGMFSDPQELSMTPFQVQCDSYSPTDRLRWFAGHIDHNDASHLTIDYELNGKSFTVDGWLRDDDTIALKVRDMVNPVAK